MSGMAYLDTHGQLSKELNRLIDTLLEIEKGKAELTSRPIAGHAKAISIAVQSIEGSIHGSYPVHHLLSIGQLIYTEIPLDILGLLATKFDVNDFDDSGMTCLKKAILNRHYNVVKWLVQNGADRNLRPRDRLPKYGKIYHEELGDVDNTVAPICLLARMKKVPLDLFNLLKTDENLNNSTCYNLPLHNALRHGMSDNALHLIELGAKVNQPDAIGFLPIEYYEKHYTHEFDKIFLRIIPVKKMGILKSICRLLDEGVDRKYEVMSQMLHCLLQRINQIGPANSYMAIHATVYRGYRSVDMQLNEELIVKPKRTFKAIYLASLLLFHLNWKIKFIPAAIDLAPHLHSSATEQDSIHARAIDAIWKTHLDRPKVKSLITLCVQKTRTYMSDMGDESFMSLPVPTYLRRLLMYADVGDVVTEAWSCWPEVTPF